MKKGNVAWILFKRILETADTLIFSAFLTAPLLLLLHVGIKRDPLLCAAILGSVAAAVALIRVHIRKRNKELTEIKEEKKKQAEQIMLMSDAEIGDRIGDPSFYMIRREQPDAFDVLHAIRSQAQTIGIFERSAANDRLLKRYAGNSTVLEMNELTDLLFRSDPLKNSGKPVRRKVLTFGVNKYVLTGLIIFLLSFFVNAKIYYRIVSSICLIFGSFSVFLHKRFDDRNFRIFLDKRGDR